MTTETEFTVVEAIPSRVEDAICGAFAQPEPLCAYVYDLSGLATHVRQMQAVLPPHCQLFYAVKANSHSAILETLASLVHGFEIASPGELGKVRAASPNARVIVNGPSKAHGQITRALEAGVQLINVESLTDLIRVNHAASILGQRAQVLLRINYPQSVITGSHRMSGVGTQFGIDENDLAEVVQELRKCAHIDAVGLHLHSVSNNLDAYRHLTFVENSVELTHRICRRYGIDFDLLDIGGGFGVDYSGNGNHFDWAVFADGLTKRASKLPDFRLILEPGRYVVAGCGYYACEIVDLKYTHGTAFAVVRGGSHHFRLPAAWKHSHPFVVLERNDWQWPYDRVEFTDVSLTVAGELCTPNDVLCRDFPVSRVRVGDVLVFPLAGAYGWDISHHDFLSHPYPITLFA